MPVLVNYNRCNCMPTCFAARACPKETLRVDTNLMKVVVDASVCGTCHAPCLNFCDAVALKYAPTLEELDITQRELDGVLTKEAAFEERKALAEKQKAAEEAAKEQEALAAFAPVKLTTQNFLQEVAQSELPVLVDFWAEWCGPCKQIAPVVEELSREFAGVIKFGKLNVDEEPQIAGQLNIQSIPTLMVFYGGQVADMIVGAVGKEQLRNRLKRIAEAVAAAKAREAAAAQPTQAPAANPTTRAPQMQPGATTRPPVMKPTFGTLPPRRPRK